MKKGIIIFWALLLVGCSNSSGDNSIEGNLLGTGPCNDQGCYANIDEHFIFIPDSVDPDGKVFDEGWFDVDVEERELDGERILFVTKLNSKEEMKY